MKAEPFQMFKLAHHGMHIFQQKAKTILTDTLSIINYPKSFFFLHFSFGGEKGK